MPVRPVFLNAALLMLLVLTGRSAHAQNGMDTAPSLRIGLHAGVQTNLIRYTVFPYRGEFQSVTAESLVPGVVLQYSINDIWRLQAEISWWSQDWSVSHEGDPRVEIMRNGRSMVEFPVLVQYRIPFPSVPVYVSVGPMLMLGTDAERIHEVRYRSFIERGGWKVTTQKYEETALRFAVVAEIGLHVPLVSAVALQPAMRFSHPFGRAVDEETYTLRDFSYWRVDVAILFSL